MEHLLRFSISLGLTLAVEVPLSLLFGVRKKGLLCVILANVLTNPATVFLLLLIRKIVRNCAPVLKSLSRRSFSSTGLSRRNCP